MKVLDTDHALTNAEVLDWVKSKRAQHAREAAQDRSIPHPKNLVKVLEKTERHLTTEAYPYESNPTAYSDLESRNEALKRFSELTMERIQRPLCENYKDKVRTKAMTVKEARSKLVSEQEKKELTEPELLMIVNHAPAVVDILQPMIESCDERFTAEELDIIVQCVRDTFRPDEGRRSLDSPQPMQMGT